MSSKQHVLSYLNNKLRQHSDSVNSQWYVGIASDPKNRLFNDHSVDEDKDKWAYSAADCDNIARAVEKHFLDAGCDGGAGGGDSATKTVYVYLKSGRTNP